METGSEFWWDESQNNNEINNLMNRFRGAQLFDSGRSALHALLSHLKISQGTVLLPEYLCESLILPFIIHGYMIIYYRIDHHLKPIIDSKLDMNLIDIFLNIDYFGFDTSKDIHLKIKKANPNIVMINDITHSWLSDFNKNYDYSFASIRKWLGIPSGGMLKGKDLPECKLPINDSFIELRTKALRDKYDYINKNKKTKTFLDLFQQAENILNSQTIAFQMDEVSKNILYMTDFNSHIIQRRSNFKYLLLYLETEKVEVIFNSLDETSCPLFFPIYIDNRDETRKKLTLNEIYCPIHWPVSNKIDKLSKTATYIYSHILSIPIDQRYTEKDMERIVKELK